MEKIRKSVLVMGIILLSITFLSSTFAQEIPKLSDAEIASVAVVANQNDIDFANIAIEKSKNTEIINFAKTMIADHQAVIDMAVTLVAKLGVTPMDNEVSKQYLENAKKTMDILHSESDTSFDKVYIDNEVTYHKTVIEAVKTVLIPQTQNEELKALLEKALPILETHLQHAEMVQSQLN